MIIGLHEEHIGLLTSYLRARQAGIVEATASNIQSQARTHLTLLQRLQLVQWAAESQQSESEKEELAAFQTTLTNITTKVKTNILLISNISNYHC